MSKQAKMEKEIKPEKKRKISNPAVALRMTEMIFCVIALALALNLSVMTDISAGFAVMFGFMIAANVVKVISSRKKETGPDTQYAIVSAFYLIFILVIIFLKDFDICFDILFMGYCLSLVFMRLISIIKKPRPLNISLNSFGILLIVILINVPYLVFEMHDALTMWLIELGVACQMFARTIKLSLAHARYDLLLKVIRKSMALEILSGLIILIIAISFVLTSVEYESIPTYGDALWYCFAVITTIGFGDFTVTTIIGRVLSVILGIYGIVVVALITSIIVNFYFEIRNEEKEDNDIKDKDDIPADDREEKIDDTD